MNIMEGYDRNRGPFAMSINKIVTDVTKYKFTVRNVRRDEEKKNID